MFSQRKVSVLTSIAIFLFSTSVFANKGQHFQEMDSNKDGRVTAAESESAAMTKFTQADANSDGMLTKGELTGFMVDEKGKPGGKAAKKSDKKMAKYDANSDGQLTQQEYMSGHKESFTKMDQNADGSVTMEEMETRKGQHKM